MIFNKSLYTKKLKEANKGDKDIYNYLHLSKSGLWEKVNSYSWFTADEIRSLKHFLSLSDYDVYKIFFGGVDIGTTKRDVHK